MCSYVARPWYYEVGPHEQEWRIGLLLYWLDNDYSQGGSQFVPNSTIYNSLEFRLRLGLVLRFGLGHGLE